MINHYRTLGVDPQAEAVVIRSAYLALIRRYHPDKGGEEADPARAQAVTAAWEVLRDPERRAAYDEARRTRFHPEGPVGSMAMAGAPVVRGGAAGRNLFLLLAAGTLGLGWWAVQQPQPEAPVTMPARPAPAVPAERVARPAEEERRAEPEPLPPLPDVQREPEVAVPVELPPLPAAEPAQMPVRAADAQTERRPTRTERAASANTAPVRQRAEERRPAVRTAPTPAPTAKAPTSARIDLAPLERHLQLLTDQSLRNGTQAERRQLFSTREDFLRRLRTCGSDACKRDAYLRRNAEVSEIMRN